MVTSELLAAKDKKTTIEKGEFSENIPQLQWCLMLDHS